MLEQLASDVKKYYYDPALHGVDWDSKVREARQGIDKANTTDDALSQIAALLDSLKDSHTFFLPPRRMFHVDYGWQAQIVGERCYIVRVRPGSDADAKGVKPGDEILSIDEYSPTRTNFVKLQYVLNVLRPQRSLNLSLRDPEGNARKIDVGSKVYELNRAKEMTWDQGGDRRRDIILEIESRIHERLPKDIEVGDELMVLKLPAFFLTDAEADSLIAKARKHPDLILDLRGNPGGTVACLKYLLGGVFDKDVKIGDNAGRIERKPVVAKAHGHSFEGKLVVLVDSLSASASELFARVIQIEKRGRVFGDQSSGRVMESQVYAHTTGVGTVVYYAAMITDADTIMTDGKSLERVGVIPDEIILPTAPELAARRDPVLSYAAQSLGVKLSPEDAGKLFPYEWAR